MIAEGEHQQQDFKMRVDDSRKIARTMVAFANSDGGRLLIGVKDNGAVVGVRPDEELHMIEAASDMYCRPRVAFSVQLWKSDNRTVMEVIIERSSDRPVQSEVEPGLWRVFIRKEDQNLPAPGVLLEVWRNKDEERPAHYAHTDREKQIFEFLRNEQEGLSLSRLMRLTKIPRPVLTRILARFIRWRLVDMHFVQDQARYTLRLD